MLPTTKAAKTKEDRMEMLRSRKKAATKVLSFLFIIAVFVVLSFWDGANDIKYFEGVLSASYASAINIVRVAFFVALFLGVTIKALQKDTFDPLLSRKERENLDERQASVRRRVLEKSYRIAAIILLVVSYVALTHDGNIVIDKSDGDLFFVFASCLLSFFVLPSIVASWEKDA